MTSINGKVAVVTGAASGIGRATAQLLSAEGALVVISDVDLKGLDKTADLIRDAGGKVSAHILDVSDRDAVYDFAAKVKSDHGGADIVINNAGVAQVARVDELSYEDFVWRRWPGWTNSPMRISNGSWTSTSGAWCTEPRRFYRNCRRKVPATLQTSPAFSG